MLANRVDLDWDHAVPEIRFRFCPGTGEFESRLDDGGIGCICADSGIINDAAIWGELIYHSVAEGDSDSVQGGVGSLLMKKRRSKAMPYVYYNWLVERLERA
jgi:hypothetical protein